MSGTLMIAGTASNSGKSLLVTGLCRFLSRRGVKVAPFKAQNMALNSAVTPGGAEIGRAQASQAEAAGAGPEAAMNPVLLKPSGPRTSQLIVMGQVAGEVDAFSYQHMKGRLLPLVLDALRSLQDRYEVVVCEGAGSPAETNLRDGDIVNMGLARAAGIPVVIAGDIDRGGVLAALFGSLALLEAADQRLVCGFLINKFRGEKAILEPGLEDLRRRTARPVLGVVPWVEGAWLDAEDSLSLQAPAPAGEAAGETLRLAVVRLPRMANFTDFDAMAAEPGAALSYTCSPAEVSAADLAILPGSKATVDDLAWLRRTGLAEAIESRSRRGDPVLGICAGYQMLGKTILDGIEGPNGPDAVEGLGLLPVETVFRQDKVLQQSRGRSPAFGGAEASGYEIHHGRTRRFGAEPVFVTEEGGEGCIQGSVAGTCWHGCLEADAFRRSLLSWVAELRSVSFVPGSRPMRQIRLERFDLLADLIEHHCDHGALASLIENGPPPELPAVRTQAP